MAIRLNTRSSRMPSISAGRLSRASFLNGAASAKAIATLVMLMSPKVDVSKGQRLPIWLCFEDGDDIEEIEIEFEVRAEAGGEGNAG